jgi:parallel beta-helix repeat protein
MKKLLTLAMMLAALLIAVPVSADPGILHVDDDDPTCGGNSPCYSTIQAAINAAGDGDTISVNPGTYDEALTLTKPITLSGADNTNTIITYSGPAVEQQVFLGTNTGLDLAGPVTIENFTLYNGGSLYGDNDLIKFRARGIGGQISIRNNIFDCDGDGSISSPAKAIEEAMQASNFVITRNEFNNCRYGIWLNGGQNGEISNNTFSEPASGAIGMGGSDAGSLAPHNLTVTGNTMDNGTFGLVLAQNIHDVLFSCNAITNNSFTGILLWEYGPENWSNVHINYNNIVSNASGMQGYYDPGGNPNITVDAINNWWGDSSGPSGNGPGTGDSVLLTNVNFDPWLMAEIGDVCPPPAVIEVEIDIKPGSDPNSINPKSRGKIPVAILSNPDFDAPSDVDWDSLTFGPDGDEESLAFCSASPEDVDDDGLGDLVCHFYTRHTGFNCGDSEGTLKGYTVDDMPIEGSDSVRIVPCK